MVQVWVGGGGQGAGRFFLGGSGYRFGQGEGGRVQVGVQRVVVRVWGRWGRVQVWV